MSHVPKYRGKKRFSEEQIREVVAKSGSKREAIISLGLHEKATNSYKVLNYHVASYGIDTSHFQGRERIGNQRSSEKIPLAEILNGDHSQYKTSGLRCRLIAAGIFEHECSVCKLTEWRGSPIPLDLDHINGVSWDHRLENLRLICKNCHAQTPNFGSKNRQYGATKKNLREKQRARYEDSQKPYVEALLSSGIDFSRNGWIAKASEIVNQSHQKVRPWMKRLLPEIEAVAYRRRS